MNKGEVFGRLTFVSDSHVKNGRNKFGWFECLCGEFAHVIQSNVKNHTTNSCGCFQRFRMREVFTRHGHKRGRKPTVEYKAFESAKARCNNPHTRRYDCYGARGIKFLFNSFEEFYAELGDRPPGMSIDRIYNNGNYEVGNVRWATPKEQAHNRR